MARRQNPAKEAAERRFRFGVDVPVPSMGFGQAINDMYSWPASKDLAREQTDQHGAGKDAHRFYAADRGIAEAFQEVFGGVLWEIPETVPERDMLNEAKRSAARVFEPA